MLGGVLAYSRIQMGLAFVAVTVTIGHAECKNSSDGNFLARRNKWSMEGEFNFIKISTFYVQSTSS